MIEMVGRLGIAMAQLADRRAFQSHVRVREALLGRWRADPHATDVPLGAAAAPARGTPEEGEWRGSWGFLKDLYNTAGSSLVDCYRYWYHKHP